MQTVNSINNTSNNTAQDNQWYRIYKPQPMAKQRVIVLAHAAGSASFYRHWSEAFPSSVEVVAIQYPGRENRLMEPMIDDIHTLVQSIANNIGSLLDKPYLLFGHSMGGAVAYELFQTLARNEQALPEHLVISAIEGPSANHDGNLHQQNDNVLKQELKKLNGTSVNLDDFPELADMVLPMMRNDYRLIETYRPAEPRSLVTAPICVMVGDSDDELSPGDAEAWEQETKEAFEIHSFPGGHFYLVDETEAVVQVLKNLLIKSQRAQQMQWPVMP